MPLPKQRGKGARYIPVAKRTERPDAIAWLLRNYPQLSDPQVVKLLATTKETIAKVRDKTHPNTPNIKPRDPVTLGLCTQTALNEAMTLDSVALRDVQRLRGEESKNASTVSVGAPRCCCCCRCRCHC